jgi:hypothetical protein
MRRYILLILVPFTHHVISQNLQYDERTTKDCVGWVDIKDSSVDTCEKTLRDWSLEPKRFHAWNPSVGLDCKPWFNLTSYCIVTQEDLDDSVYYTTLTMSDHGNVYTMPRASLTTDADGWTIPVTKSGVTTRSSSTSAPIPLPSSWKDMGCYVDNWNDGENGVRVWNLDFRYIPRDPEETVNKCKEKCYHIQYRIAGLKGGNECWCGDQNNATLAENQKDCNTPCGGDAKVICGGTQRMNVFAAQGNAENGVGTSTEAIASATGSGPAASTRITGATATASSGARRNGAMLWWR